MNLIKYLVVLIIVLSTTNFGMYVLYNELNNRLEPEKIMSYNDGFSDGTVAGLRYIEETDQKSILALTEKYDSCMRSLNDSLSENRNLTMN